MIKAEIKGLRELDERLKQLPVEIGRKVLTSAVRSGAYVIRREAIARAPVGKDDPHPRYGRLSQNIRTAAVAERSASATVLVHTGRAFWARFVEFGTGVRRVRRKRVMSDGTTFYGLEVAPMPARPFMRPAFDAKSRTAVDAIAKALARGIDRAVAKLAAGRRR